MKTQIGFIGAGNIVRAILSGIEKSGRYAHDVIGIFDIAEAVRQEFKSKGYVAYESIEELVKGASIVVVAVTPQVIGKISGEIRKAFTSDKIILSVAAGIDNAWYEEHIDGACRTVRCMPTLTAQEGMGSFAVCRSKSCTDEDYKRIYDFLDSCGIVEEIQEELMTEVVAFNGSAPGYFYHMANVIVKEAIAYGFDENTASRLFAQSMKGSAETILNSGMTIDTLETKLRLPGGTTLAALDKMEKLGFDRCLQEGIKACIDRCRELGKL